MLETSGTLAYISIASTSGPDVLTEEPSISVAGAVKMVYNGNLNQLYIAGGSQVAVVDVSQSVPALLGTIPITAVPATSRGTLDPCAATTVTTLNTIDVTALPDNSQAYAGSYYEAAVGGVNYICPQVTVINTTSNSIGAPTVAIPGFPAYEPFCTNTRFRVTMASGVTVRAPIWPAAMAAWSTLSTPPPTVISRISRCRLVGGRAQARRTSPRIRCFYWLGPNRKLSGDCGPLVRWAAEVAQRHIHKNLAIRCVEAHHQCFGVFAAFAALF